MAGDKAQLKRFPAGKVILLKGSTLNELMDLIDRTRPRPGRNVTLDVTPKGTIIHATGGGGVAEQTCALGSVFEKDGDFMLRGGQVLGGSGNVLIEDSAIGSVSSPPTDGTIVFLDISLTGNEEDGMLMPGCTVTDATVESGSTLPDNELPAIGSLSGALRVLLGSWQGGAFYPSGCGNFQVGFCPGTISYSRG